MKDEAASDSSETVVFARSRAKMLALALGFFILTLLCAYIALGDFVPYRGKDWMLLVLCYGGLLFAAVATVYVLWIAMFWHIDIVIHRDGFRDYFSPYPIIAWRRIQFAELLAAESRNPVLSLALKEGSNIEMVRMKFWPKSIRIIKGFHVDFHVGTLKAPPTELLQAARAAIARYGEGVEAEPEK